MFPPIIKSFQFYYFFATVHHTKDAPRAPCANPRSPNLNSYLIVLPHFTFLSTISWLKRRCPVIDLVENRSSYGILIFRRFLTLWHFSSERCFKHSTTLYGIFECPILVKRFFANFSFWNPVAMKLFVFLYGLSTFQIFHTLFRGFNQNRLPNDSEVHMNLRFFTFWRLSEEFVCLAELHAFVSSRLPLMLAGSSDPLTLATRNCSLHTRRYAPRPSGVETSSFVMLTCCSASSSEPLRNEIWTFTYHWTHILSFEFPGKFRICI